MPGPSKRPASRLIPGDGGPRRLGPTMLKTFSSFPSLLPICYHPSAHLSPVFSIGPSGQRAFAPSRPSLLGILQTATWAANSFTTSLPFVTRMSCEDTRYLTVATKPMSTNGGPWRIGTLTFWNHAPSGHGWKVGGTGRGIISN